VPVAQTPNATLWQPTAAPADAAQATALQAVGQPAGRPGFPQGPMPGGRGTGTAPDEGAVSDQTIQLEPPGFERIFGRRDSEDQLKERIRQDKRNRGQFQDRVGFPDEPVLSKEPYYGRRWAPGQMIVEPNYLCYKRLLFEQKNMERYDWDLGPLGVMISPALFYADIVTLPYHLATDPFRKCECNTGYCLPGDPVPLLLYPPDLSVTGTLAEAATVAALIAIFP
jgi:hypothetical protein